MSGDHWSENAATPAFLTWVRLSGGAAIAIGVIGLLAQTYVWANPERFGGIILKENRVILTGAILICLIGGGILTLYLRKSGLILVAILLAIPGTSLGVGSIVGVPFPWVLINLVFAAGFFAPSWLVVKGWRQLRW